MFRTANDRLVRWRAWHLLTASALTLLLHLMLLAPFWRHRRTIEPEAGLWRALASLEFAALLAALLLALPCALLLRRTPPRWRVPPLLAALSLATIWLLPFSHRGDFQIWSPIYAGLPPADTPNVVLLISDSLRADVFDDADSARVRFPRLSELREESLDYRQLHAASSWTPPSMASMLTGLAPSQLGAHQGVLPDSAASFVERLRDAGYETVGISDNHLTHPRYGYAQGFTRYWQRNNCIPFAESPLSHWRFAALYERWVRWCGLQYRGAERVDAVLARWQARRDRRRPFFLLIHYMDTHYPYYVYHDRPGNLSLRAPQASLRHYSQVQLLERDLPKAPFAHAQLSAAEHENFWLRYLGSAQVVDESVGRIVDWLREDQLLDQTLIVFTADHGEEFHEHGTLAHGRALYQESIRVPLFLRPLPWSAEPGAIDAPCTQRALPNTILAATGLRLLPDAPDPLPSSGARLGSAVYSELDRSGTRILAGRYGDLKLLLATTRQQRARSELYRLDEDPRERVDLGQRISELPPALLASFNAEWVRLIGHSGTPPDARHQELLRGLGYLR